MKRILHATDFAARDAAAFAHTLRFALDAHAKLYLLHVATEDGGEHWSQFPHVRDVLGRWGLLDPRDSPRAIEEKLGLHVAKVSVHAPNVARGIAKFAQQHECDFLTLWTHDRRGPLSWLGSGAVAGEIARIANVQTMFFPGDASGFVDRVSGRSTLGSVLIPVDAELDCADALDRMRGALQIVAPEARFHFLHVGDKPPMLPANDLGAGKLLLRQGPVVSTILSVAREIRAGLIAMPTAGRQGMFDALRGSTTERVLREAGLPILATPV